MQILAMARRLLLLLAIATLLAAAGCSNYERPRRPPWRSQAESACLAQNAIHVSAFVQPARAIEGPGICGLDHPFKVSGFLDGAVQLNSAYTLDCPMIAALNRWLTEVVQPAARARFGEEVAGIDSMGAYSCRTMNNMPGGRISEHAFGNALDIGGFRLTGGREISIVRDWWRGDEEARAFLQDVHAGACEHFTTVLSPGSNIFHYNHIHLDLALHGNTANGLRRIWRPFVEPTRPLGPPRDTLHNPPEIYQEHNVAYAKAPTHQKHFRSRFDVNGTGALLRKTIGAVESRNDKNVMLCSSQMRSYAFSVRELPALCALFTLALVCGLSPAAAAPLLYVTNEGANTVSVIDTATNHAVAAITVGASPSGIAVTPDGSRAFVANAGSNSISVIDTAARLVVATIPAGVEPAGVAAAPSGKYAAAANEGSGNISLIDTQTNRVAATIPAGNRPYGIAIAPDGKRAYVANLSGSISVIDLVSNRLEASIPAGGNPTAVAIAPDGKRAYVTNGSSSTVSVIDTQSNKVVAAIPAGDGTSGIAITPDGARAFAVNEGSGDVTVIDTATGKPVATVTAGGERPFAIAISPDGKRAYVTNGYGANTVTVIDTAVNAVVAEIPAGERPIGIAAAPMVKAPSGAQ